MERWLDYFPQEQVHAFLFDDVRREPKTIVEAVSRHLGVAPVFDEEQLRKTREPWLGTVFADAGFEKRWRRSKAW